MVAFYNGRKYFLGGVLAFLCIIFLFVIYFVTVVARGLMLYPNINETPVRPLDQRGAVTTGRVFEFDPVVGIVTARNGQGEFLIAKGEPVPVLHDKNGFRVLEGTSEIKPEKSMLFLGDSFTYGQLVSTKNNFATISARQLGIESLNAAVPGHGLAHMLLQARKFIPKYEPDFVIIQYSPWLVSRATQDSAFTSNGLIMAPYFFEDQDGSIEVHPAPFSPSNALFELSDKYKLSVPSFSDKVSFLFEVAVPFFIKRDVDFSFYNVKSFLGLQPEPLEDGARIIEFAYDEISSVTKKNGGKVFILVLGMPFDFQVPLWLLPPEIAVINAHSTMVSLLNPKTANEYARQYHQWRGEPPELVDGHPNENAHRLIANDIVESLKVELAE